MSETTQSAIDYENSSKLDMDLNKDNLKILADNATFEETVSELNGVEKPKLLSKKDFFNYFEGEDFQQINGYNCRLLAVIDSLVSFGDYEELIRTSVIKNSKGYTFYLPLGAPHLDSYKFFVSYEELKTNQVRIDGKKTILVKGKQGIQALVLAYGKKCTGKYGQFDYNNLGNGYADYALNDLVYGINSYWFGRSKSGSETTDPNGTINKRFTNKLYKTLESFDKKYDMLTLGVNQREDSYSSLGHYSAGSNHEISVEKVRKEKGTLIVTVSNPQDSNKFYDIKFEDLIKSCDEFNLGTKKERKRLKKSNGTYEGKRTYKAADNVDKFGYVDSVNQVVQITGRADKALREVRGDILVTENENSTFKVSSYDLEMNIKERCGQIIIYNNGIELSINKAKLLNKYKYDGKTVENDQYPLLLYGAKIANFVNMMRNLYIDQKKWDENNNTPFCLVGGRLQFDDNPNSFKSADRIKRQCKELIGDDYIECLRDWESLGIDSSDDETKQKIVDFLNQLVENKKATS